MINLDIELTDEIIKEATNKEVRASFGHIGTHIDLKGKSFDNQEVKGIVFKCEDNKEINDVDLSLVKENYFVIFDSNHCIKYPYGTSEYFKDYSILSNNLIERLIEKKVSFIGIDGPGIRKGKEHPLIDSYLANKNIFVIENLVNLDLLEDNKVYTIKLIGKTEADDGLPLEVIVNDD